MKNIFELLTPKQKENFYEDLHTNELFLYLQSMFEYDGFPESVDTRFIERYMITTGACGFGIVDEKLVVTQSYPCGEPNDYGIGTQIIGTTRNGGSYQGNIGETTAYGFNNASGRADFELYKVASDLTEIDKSLNCNIINSRYTPFIAVSDEKTKKALQTALDNTALGKVVTFLSNNILKKFADGTSGLEVVNITDVKNSDKIQYLAHHKDDVLRWFFTKYGQCNNGTGKMAQQSVDEITGDLSISFIIPMDRLKERQKMCKMVNKVFGLNTSVRFSPSWEVEYKKFTMSATNDADASTEESTQESAQTSAEDDAEGGEENE